MIDRHEDPRDHVHSFYIVSYANADIGVLQTALNKVKEKGFPLRRFKRTQGFLNYSKGFLPKLKQHTFTLYARRHDISDNVYQIETPTEFDLKDRVELQNVVTNILIDRQISSLNR
jgi:hypothetical protein